MLHETERIIGRRGGKGKQLVRAERVVAYPTIGRDAERLGVSRPHLWMVLTGRRQSESLLRRYTLLKRRQES